VTTTRREFIGAGVTAGALAFGPGFWRIALAAEARAAASAYGPLQPPDANGLMLPPGFTAREVARANRVVAGYPWHIFCDGQATYPTDDGGWVLVSNSESVAATGAGTSALRFARDGRIEAAYRILAGTNSNCAGGATPWGTWLSCEEHDAGYVWECDPQRAGQGSIRPALGTFAHEAVAVDPVQRRLYMTEDRPDGGFYRFTPDAYPSLGGGRLEIAVDAAGGRLNWAEVPDPAAIAGPTRNQVPAARRFNGGEGIWFDFGIVYFSTKGDNRIWSYDTGTGALGTIYDLAATPGAPLSGVDNLTVSRAGEVFVCEDGGDMEICVIGLDGTVAPFLRLTGEAAAGLPGRGNELAGVVFAPSGERLYFAAQRAFGLGAVYEVAGPFQGAGVAPAPARPEPPQTPAGPRLDVEVPRSATVASLRRPGLQVRVAADRPVTLSVALRSDELRTVPGRRGSDRRPATVTLARRRGVTAAIRDRVSLRLRVTAARSGRLRRRRRTAARLTVMARDEAGRVTIVTRDVRLQSRRR
jgi:hypothetical protein